ncbi:hypothetical protein [Mesorhizobium sp. KR9-304]|uniref:hypothetical protein n=1 Tax=Mesorhizobium sp. KR9-304 TaxID=3156614 RepID=UPI0032B43F92
MNKLLSILAATALSLLAGATGYAIGGEQPNLLIVGEDADRDTVPRNSRIFNRVLQAISGEMQTEGFKVYDETAVSLDVTDPSRVRRTDAELLTVARRIQDAPIDAIAVFQIYASAEKNAFADITDLRIRIPGRLINVTTGQALGSFEVSYDAGDLPPLPPQCNRDCILENVGDEAKRIATDVGAVLASKLDVLAPTGDNDASIAAAGADGSVDVQSSEVAIGPTSKCTGLTTGYSLTFRGFDSEEYSRIEEYLVAFRGYDHHRPVKVGLTQAEYWYESCSDVARLNRNLRMMAEHMGFETRIGMVRNRFEVDKIEVPKKR